MHNLQTHITQLESYLDYLKSQSDLTSLDVILHNNTSWGLCMKGTIRTKEKCPVCNKSFENVDNRLLICKEHFTIPTRYFIDLYWHGRQLKIYSDSNGRPLNYYELAYRLLTEIRQKIDKPGKFDPADYVAKRYIDMQFPDYARKWISRYKEIYDRKEISKITWSQKKGYTELLLIPFFKKYDIRDIKTGDVDDFYFSLSSSYKPMTKIIIMNILKLLFKYAKKRKDIKEMPDFPIIKVNEEKIKWIDEEIQKKIYAHIPDKFKPIFLFMMRQGVRPGEARALKYEDIDRKARTVTIQRTFSDNEIKENTKTRKIRVLPLDDEVYDMLCKRDQITGFVFTHDGRPYTQNKSIGKVWNKAVKAAGLEHITMYNGTRHSFASQAVNRGVPLNLIQDFLGHTTQTMTRRYAHIDTEGLKIVIDKKAKVLRMKK